MAETIAAANHVNKDVEGDTVLGLTSASVDVTFGGTTAVLSLETEVVDHDAWSTQRRFGAVIYLLVNGVKQCAGEVTGYHILKPSTTHPHRSHELWMDHWLKGPESKYGDGTIYKEIASAMRALYKNTRAPRPTGHAARGLDHTDDLVFLQKIYIKLAFAGKGLLRHVIPLFHQCLTQPASTSLPANCLVTGAITYFLEPGLLDDKDEAAMWKHLEPKTNNPTDAELDAYCMKVETELEKIYTRPSTGFDVRIRQHVVFNEYHTVLGRHIEAPAPATPVERPAPSSGTFSAHSKTSISPTVRSPSHVSPRPSTTIVPPQTAPLQAAPPPQDAPEVSRRFLPSPSPSPQKRGRKPEDEDEDEESHDERAKRRKRGG